MTRNACRHYGRKGVKPTCAAGRDIKAWVQRCGDPIGWGLQIPCVRNAPDTPLFDCPEVDRDIDEEVAARRKAMKDEMDRLIRAMPRLTEIKRRMIAERQAHSIEICPWCGAKTLNVSIALDYNKHAHMVCATCDKGIME